MLLGNLSPVVSQVFPAETADALNALLLSVDNQVINSLVRQGYVLPGLKPQQSLTSLLKDTKRFQEAMAYFRQAERNHQPLNLVDGVLALFGIRPYEFRTSKKYELFRNIAENLKPLIVRFLGESTYDQLFGYQGSKAVLGKALIMSFYPYGISPTQLNKFTDALHTAFQLSPHLRQGYDNAKVAQIIEQFVKRGLMPLTSDLMTFIENVTSALRLYRFLSDAAQKKAPGQPIPDDVIFESIEALRKQFPGRDLRQIEFLVRSQAALTERYPYGEFQAAIQETGIPLAPVIETPEGQTGYAILDEKLKQRALNSPFGSLIGATIRAVERMGARGPLKDFYDKLLSGEVPYVTPDRWFALAVNSGLTPQQASALLSQNSANKAAVASSPIWLRILRLAQYEYDIAPKLRAMIRPGEDPEIVRGKIAELAESLGYSSVGPLDAGQIMLLMHSPFVNQKALRVLQASYQEARWQEMIPDKTRIEPLRRLSEYAIGYATGTPRLTIRDLLNLVPPESAKAITKSYESILPQYSPFEENRYGQKGKTLP